MYLSPIAATKCAVKVVPIFAPNTIIAANSIGKPLLTSNIAIVIEADEKWTKIVNKIPKAINNKLVNKPYIKFIIKESDFCENNRYRRIKRYG